MAYASVSDLLERATAQELAEVGGRDAPLLGGEGLAEHLGDPARPAAPDLDGLDSDQLAAELDRLDPAEAPEERDDPDDLLAALRRQVMAAAARALGIPDGLDPRLDPEEGADELARRIDAVRAQAATAVGRLEDALEAAAEEVDGYVRSSHPRIDPDAPPAPLKLYSLDIAMYRLFGGEPQSERHVRYLAALHWLRAVARGDVNLAPAADAAQDGVLVDAGERTFTPSSLEGYLHPGLRGRAAGPGR